MKKIYILITTLILFIPKLVDANSISRINMNIYVDNNGTAHVTETWDANLSSGTEGYKPYYNIGESKISNFKVTINNTNYTYTDNWDVNGSFESKKYKNGFNYIDNGIELCFGISRYGANTYKLSYDISNFVVNTSDGYQMIYWTLFPHNYNPSPGRVYIKIYSDFKYSNTLDVWGYGKGGAPTYVYDGVIEMDSENKVNSSEYMTILVKFPSNTFNTSVVLDKTFDEYLSMANEGAIGYSAPKQSFFDVLLAIVPIILSFSMVFIPIIVLSLKPKYGTYKIKIEKKKNKDVPYFREIPYKKEKLSRAYWVACQYNLVLKPTDYLGAILLKWLKLGNITLKKEDKKNIFGSKEETIIIFNNCINLDSKEVELYQMMYESSGDGKLEKNEFEVWCKENYSKILKWFNIVVDDETEKLIQEGFLTQIDNKKKCTVNSTMEEEAMKVIGLKRFLNDFSNIKDRTAIEVNLWEEYLMYACIFGIAKKVMKEFKDLYPDVITEEVYNDITFIHHISYSGMNRAITARDKARSYSSGGGGFSSSGGGGGSFGGGGGGGGVR